MTVLVQEGGSLPDGDALISLLLADKSLATHRLLPSQFELHPKVLSWLEDRSNMDDSVLPFQVETLFTIALNATQNDIAMTGSGSEWTPLRIKDHLTFILLQIFTRLTSE